MQHHTPTRALRNHGGHTAMTSIHSAWHGCAASILSISVLLLLVLVLVLLLFSPWRILDDTGAAFCMGAIGGGVFHSFKGYTNSPEVSSSMQLDGATVNSVSRPCSSPLLRRSIVAGSSYSCCCLMLCAGRGCGCTFWLLGCPTASLSPL